MVHLLIQHDVESFDDWKPVFDDNADARIEHGSKGYELYTSLGDDSRVIGIIDFEDEAGARTFAESTELKERMAEAGVVGKPTFTFLEEVERTAPEVATA